MAKRRSKRGKKPASTNDEGTTSTEQKSKKGRLKSRMAESRKHREDLLIFVSLFLIIMIIFSGYFAYDRFIGRDDGGGNGDLVNPDGGKTPPDGDGSDDDEPFHGVDLQVLSEKTHIFDVTSRHDVDINGKTDFCLLVTNTGNIDDSYDLKYSGSAAGWAVDFGTKRIAVKENGAMVVILTLTASDSGSASLWITATSVYDPSATDSATVEGVVKNMGTRTVNYGDDVSVYYVLVDRGTDAKFNSNKWSYNQGGEFPFTVGSGVITGFSDMAVGMKEGETRVERIPADLAYGSDPNDGKPDGELIYEMYMQDIK